MKTIGFNGDNNDNGGDDDDDDDDDLSNCTENLKSVVEVGQRPRMMKEVLLPGANSQTEDNWLQHSLSNS